MKKNAEALKKTLGNYSSLLIIIKGSPDPDALASAFALKVLADYLLVDSYISATTKLSLPQNRALVSRLNIPINFAETHPEAEKFEAYAVVDHPDATVQGLTGNIPCAAHIDHHKKSEEEILCDIKITYEDAGSTSTIIALIFRELHLEIKPTLLCAVSTALIYGIQTDTDKYRHAGKFDYEAINYLSKYADNQIINKITGLPMSEKTAVLLAKAVQEQEIYMDWLITGIGYIKEVHRDSIAIIADFLLARHKEKVVFVFAIIEGDKNSRERLRLDVSIRTEDEEMLLNDIIKSITYTGGARKFKGAYQIDIDYFFNSPDRDLLWDLIKTTTVATIKNQKDTYSIKRIRGAFRRFIDKITGKKEISVRKSE